MPLNSDAVTFTRKVLSAFFAINDPDTMLDDSDTADFIAALVRPSDSPEFELLALALEQDAESWQTVVDHNAQLVNDGKYGNAARHQRCMLENLRALIAKLRS